LASLSSFCICLCQLQVTLTRLFFKVPSEGVGNTETKTVTAAGKEDKELTFLDSNLS
jgi:hypothetical protein